jgi:capsular exopolysaccharide synthesis family protein
MKDNNQELSDNLITDFNSPAAEAMQTFQVNLSLSDFRHPAQVIGVTSAIQGEGKSTFSVNLANTYAFRGAKTVLVNFDIRKPVVHLLYNVKNDVGLTEYVAGDCTLDEIIKTTPQGVDLVNPGTPTPYPTRILDSAKIKDLISELRKRYQFIIVDLPPVLVVTDALLVSKYIDGYVVVAAQKLSKKKNVDETVKILSSGHANVYGIVMTRVTDLGENKHVMDAYQSAFSEKKEQ